MRSHSLRYATTWPPSRIVRGLSVRLRLPVADMDSTTNEWDHSTLAVESGRSLSLISHWPRLPVILYVLSCNLKDADLLRRHDHLVPGKAKQSGEADAPAEVRTVNSG